jgi:hypothetical protein
VELHSDYESICEQYLLGELSESECQQLEEAYFADDSLFERFMAVKEDLLDAYSRGDLIGNKLERFERHYLTSTLRRQRVEEARELIQATSIEATTDIEARHETRQPFLKWPWFARFSHQPIGWSLGFIAVLLLIVAGGWIVIRQIQDRSAGREKEQVLNTTKPGGNIVEGASPSSTRDVAGEAVAPGPTPTSGSKSPISTPPAPSPTSAQIASITLLPFSSRDTSGAESLVLNRQVRLVRISLIFSGESYHSFETSVRTVDGKQVMSRRGLKATVTGTRQTVTITFDSSLLNRQDYIATLSGRTKNGILETIADYYFRVQHTSTQ